MGLPFGTAVSFSAIVGVPSLVRFSILGLLAR
jgi:hypothetical protein